MSTAHVLGVVAFVGLVATGAAFAQSRLEKAPPPDVGSGRVAWFDITTSNIARAKSFYADLFDWKFTPVEGTDQAVEIVARDLPIGTLRVTEGAITPFNGVIYVQVADIAASCKKAASLGATILPGFPFNLTDRPGAIALLTDPTGHPIGMYSRTRLPAK